MLQLGVILCLSAIFVSKIIEVCERYKEEEEYNRTKYPRRFTLALAILVFIFGLILVIIDFVESLI